MADLGPEGIAIDMSDFPKPDGYEDESDDYKRGYMEAVILMVVHGVPEYQQLGLDDVPQELKDAAGLLDEDDDDPVVH